MKKSLLHNWHFFLIFFFVFFIQIGANGAAKNVLFINSYNQGYAWTDSLTSGIINAAKGHSELSLYIKHLNSKKFGQTKFELEKEYIQSKYQGIQFDGIIVADNDALDFALKYDKELFPNVPVVYVGIANPEEYPLEGSNYYGIKETGDSKQVLTLVRKLLPNSKCLFVITDNTTTGKVNRVEFTSEAKQINDFSVIFPVNINLDSIYEEVSQADKFDAIFYMGISLDENGKQIDPVPVIRKISQIAKVPVFTNDPVNQCPGVLGGLFRKGVQDGREAVKMLVELMEPSFDRKNMNHINQSAPYFFFDKNVLDQYNISEQRLPLKSRIFNQKRYFTRENFVILLIVLVFLSLAFLLLSIGYYRGQKEHKRNKKELKEVEIQKNELELANENLAITMAKLEDTNWRLNDLNEKLILAKKKAEESDKLKSAFLANVSHEIRTPLNSIVGFSSLLVDGNLNEEARKSYVELVESNTESLLVLIDEILDLSKIEAQQLSLNKQNFSVDSLIPELYQVFTLNQKNHQVQLQINVWDSQKELFAFSDRVRVKQIFINLLSNAFKFTDSGIIEFGYFLSDAKEVILYVKDTGIGIKEEHHQAVFQRFRKLNEVQDKRIYRGTGLGLAITQKLVELLGGKIWIESQLGIGSAFYFTLQNLELKAREA